MTREEHYGMLGLTDTEDAMGQPRGLGSSGGVDDEPREGSEKQEYPRE